MSQQDNFSGGFVLGAIVGGVIGGVLGSLLTAQRLEGTTEDPLLKSEDGKNNKTKKRSIHGSTEQDIEIARRSLEDKIAQLNDSIDDVRQQLGSVNGRATEIARERSFTEEP
ncbi:hypothetical protein C7B65_22285 [Phormidesmis priestleyi ULC007]|uniref:Gas vesicle protein n=1 Tax=Phormidesmis priestleyi ULC007 TaxID=1920490 RepID=A0A2T1D747_9CYAN|nr:hypothetical protein [Phormidesmis priestleyi]PSB16254.1 hypothetical protein C7B65_22285 [Phormidesmis priestleyi ULC007]PZO46866.1 MAG: hypothetical protein DCF14_21445 [Phormidesmis priestleyi]